MSLDNRDRSALKGTSEPEQLQSVAKLVPEQYLLLSKLTQGGMGSIYRAQNRFTLAQYAIKVLLPEHVGNEEFRNRFIAEARAASSLRHPHICQVHDFGITKGQFFYLVMDWIDGISLQQKVMQDGPLKVDTALLVYRQTAMALAHAHQHHIIHRDLKPDNIMLSNSALPDKTHAYLVDFGLAKELNSGIESHDLTTVGMVVGTPMFMSPEQTRAQTLDGRSDIYSLGCAMYFALCGHAPFRGNSVVDTMFKQVHEAPKEFDPTLKIPADLRSIVFKSMEKAQERRYQSADQLLQDIEKLIGGVSIGKISLTSEEQKRRQYTVTVGLFIVGFLVMYFVSIWLQSIFDKPIPDKESKVHVEEPR